MPANGAIYIQHDNVDLTKVFGKAKSDKGLFRKPTYFELNLGGDAVLYNIMDSSQITRHIEGFLKYIDSLDQDEKRKRDTSYAISQTKTVLGLETDKEFDENHAIWQSLFKIADAYDGFVFVYDSILLPNGTVLVGSLLEQNT